MSGWFSQTPELPEPRGHGGGQHGLTLVELMIAVLISSLLIGFLFGTYTRMSTAYRSQTSVSEVQQRLRLAKELIVRDLRPAGNLIPQGFSVNPAVDAAYSLLDLSFPVPPIITRTGGGSTPDSIHAFYADTNIGTEITDYVSDTEVTVAQAAQFDDFIFTEGNGLAVIIRPYQFPASGGKTRYNACVVKITGVSGSNVSFDSSPPGGNWNSATNDHCRISEPPIDPTSLPSAPPATAVGPGNPSIFEFTKPIGDPDREKSMIYAFAARAYRIDPTRPAAGILQRSMTGGMEDDWEDIGVGFTDLQVARRFLEPGDADDADLLDGDPTLDWFSGLDDPITPPAGVTLPIDAAQITELSVSITARTVREVDAPGSKEVPALMDGDPNHNPVGDSPAVTLEGVPDGSRPPQHQGNHVYRTTTQRIDIRNQMWPRGYFRKRL